MSGQQPWTRRPHVRIIPVKPVESSDPGHRTASKLQALSQTASPRLRSYGAPLISGTRSSLRDVVPGRVGTTEVSDTPLEVGKAEPTIATEDDSADSLALSQYLPDDAPVIFWDLPPRPVMETGGEAIVSAWVTDVDGTPTDLHLAELGSYLMLIANSFSDFCRTQCIVDSGQWQARLEMPGRVLPDTILQIEVSALHARLRFETNHTVSREVLERHCDVLRLQVDVALGRSREVEVSVW